MMWDGEPIARKEWTDVVEGWGCDCASTWSKASFLEQEHARSPGQGDPRERGSAAGDVADDG